jgi:SPP1 family predicted phage head-tail adaptor
MKAKRLPHQITIQKLQDPPARNSSGGVIETWEDFATVFASVNPISGREYFAAQAAQAATTHHIDMWWISGVTSDMRIKFGKRIFEIESIVNVNELNRELNLLCVEKGEVVE